MFIDSIRFCGEIRFVVFAVLQLPSLQNSITPFFLLSLLAEQSQALQHRTVGYRENDRRLFAGFVSELIPIPRRNKETIFRSPIQIISNRFFFADAGDAVSLHDMIDGTAGVALRFRRHALWNELHPATDGGHG